MPDRRVLALRALEQSSGHRGCCGQRRAARQRQHVAEAECLQVGQAQAADGRRDVRERARALVSPGCGVGQLPRADGVEHDDEGAPGHSGEPIPRRARTGVRALEGRAQRAVAEVRVDLRRRHGRMAEQLLNDPQIGAALEQVRRK